MWDKLLLLEELFVLLAVDGEQLVDVVDEEADAPLQRRTHGRLQE